MLNDVEIYVIRYKTVEYTIFFYIQMKQQSFTGIIAKQNRENGSIFHILLHLSVHSLKMLCLL